MWNYLYIFSWLYCIATAVTYNTYHGVPATCEEIAEFEAKNITDICTVTFEPCDEAEWRRLDGSCNNLEHPSLGMYHTRMLRLLEANYSEGYEPRKTNSGNDFPLARYLRLFLVKVGKSINQEIAASASYFAEFISTDLISGHDLVYFMFENTHCCEEEGLKDPMCAPNFIPEDDNVHRFSGIRCFNMTRPLSFQNRGCVSADSVPERINAVTTFVDLSNIYQYEAGSIQQNRAYEGGRLKVEVVNGKTFPSDANANTTCFIKEAKETGCSRNVPNGLLGANLFGTWFWRLHNHIANGLAAVNPHWNDDRLFNASMDMNVACYSQILYYEFFPLMFGKKNLMDAGVIHSDDGHRDPYDKNVHPRLFIEYAYAWRWFHKTQDARQRMFDKNGNYVATRPIVDFIFDVEELAFNDTMAGLTHGICKQGATDFDTAHTDMSDYGLGSYAKAFDILTADLSRGRYYGLASYMQYRDMCTNYTIKHKSFEDLKDIIDPERIEILKSMYKSPGDIELMAGMWSERRMKGAWAPPTVYCIIVKQLARLVASDRHLYERPNRPHAFDEEQLKNVRQITLAGILCTVGDEVSKIQPNAFLRIGPGNYEVSCDSIPKINFTLWKDDKLQSKCDANL